MHTVWWEDGTVRLIDQRRLPEQLEVLALADVASVVAAIHGMAVRGAPAIGATAAYGLALAARVSPAGDIAGLLADLTAAAGALRAARATAVNLGWALDRVQHAVTYAARSSCDVDAVRAAALAEAERIADEDVAACRRMGAHGAALLPDPATVIHHCNTGALATVDFGTALGVVRAAHEAGKRVHVLVDETRPRLQGALLTAWELGRLGVPHTLIVDGAAGHFLSRGGVDAVLVGADRIAASGDTANKIGTYGLAVLARTHDVPFYVVAPTTTIDLVCPNGGAIPIEQRAEDEVTHVRGRAIAPPGTRAANPAFDVTPHGYISAIITDQGVVRPPFAPGLRAVVASAVPAGGDRPDGGVAATPA
jgi:methylthioribose-1-phosphate isomerase